MTLLWRRRRDLHPDQIHAIEGLPPDGRYLLMGPPGSGKTSILLHRGQYLRMPPHHLTNIRLITFTRTLREFIAVSGNDRFPPTLIQTVKEFIDEIFETYGAQPPILSNDLPLAEKNKIRAAAANEIIGAGERRLTYDALLIDEIQDLSGAEIELFSRLSDRLMMVGDSRQKLFDADGGLEAVEKLGCHKIELKHHFRISRDICRVADSILLPGDYRLEEFCHYQGPTPSPPAALGDQLRQQQISSLVDALDLQLDTYNDPADLIGVVAWRKVDCDFISDSLSSTRFGEMCRVFHSDIEGKRFEQGSRICIVTVQSCKGLEFRALHWLFADENSFHITRERAYTVVTRAKSSLIVYHNRVLPASLAGSLPTRAQSIFEEDDD